MRKNVMRAPVNFYERLDEIGRDEEEKERAKDYFAWAELFAGRLVRAIRFAWRAKLADSRRALGPHAP
jgi:hypothetical protein